MYVYPGTFINYLSSKSKLDVLEHEPSMINIINQNHKKNVKNLYKNIFEKNNEKYDLIVSFDTIEHLQDHNEFINYCNKRLKKNGKILITVPAFNFLWSYHDEVCHHYRRYSKKDLVNLFSDFKILKFGYFNFFLFPIVFIKRYLLNFFKINENTHTKSPFLNLLLYYIFSIEKYIVPFNIFPFGVSIFMIVEKKND